MRIIGHTLYVNGVTVDKCYNENIPITNGECKHAMEEAVQKFKKDHPEIHSHVDVFLITSENDDNPYTAVDVERQK